MTDLNLGPAPESSPLKSILIAAAVLIAVAAAVFYLNPRKTADLTITKTTLYATQTSSDAKSGVGGIVGQAGETNNDFYIVVTLRIANKLRLPIFINGINATYTPPDGAPIAVQSMRATDIPRVEEIFPAIKPLMTNPLTFDNGIDPKSATEGTVLLQFPGVTEAAWKSRKSATLTVDLAHQDPQTITIPQ
jgi:hypothetical protein